MNNYCGNHKCSNYCHIITIMKGLYHILKQNNVKDTDILNENLIRYAKLKTAKCRMDFGKLQNT